MRSPVSLSSWLLLYTDAYTIAAGNNVLLNTPIQSLEFLSLMENTDIPLQYARQLDTMYSTVKRDDDDDLKELDEDELAENLEEHEDQDVTKDEDDLADLAGRMGSFNV
jgi:hypothetical protein